MSVKLLMMRSGDSIITDIEEMVIDNQVVGYFLTKPCIVRLQNPEGMTRDKSSVGFKIKMYPWMPLTKDERIPVALDWVVTITNPVDELLTMFNKEVLKNDQVDSVDGSDSDHTD
jgi:hypothetical protein